MAEEGIRVTVIDGSGKGPQRLGTLVGTADVYVKHDGTSILSHKDAAAIPAEGTEDYLVLENNPKIVLDDGEVVYGCQVWWGPASPDDADAVAKILYGEG